MMRKITQELVLPVWMERMDHKPKAFTVRDLRIKQPQDHLTFVVSPDRPEKAGEEHIARQSGESDPAADQRRNESRP